MSSPTTGASLRRSTTAGEGLGSMPWLVRTMPVPTRTVDDDTSSTPRVSRAAQVPTMSTMASMPPTSWKWTDAVGRRWSPHPVGEAGLLEDPGDVPVGAGDHVGLRRHVGLGGRQPAPHHRLRLQLPPA